MQGEVGTSSSRATGWEDGVYFWILWEKRWEKTDKKKISMTDDRSQSTSDK